MISLNLLLSLRGVTSSENERKVIKSLSLLLHHNDIKSGRE